MGSHIAIENHGAVASSNQCDTSWPGLESIGAWTGSRPSVSVQVTLLPDPAFEERNVTMGSSCPMYTPLS